MAFKEMIDRAQRERGEEQGAQGTSAQQGGNSTNSQQSDVQNEDQIPDLEDAPAEDQKQEDSTENSQTLTTYNSEPSERPSTPSSNQSVRDKKGGFPKTESEASREESLDSSFDSKKKKSVQGDSNSERGDQETDLPNLLVNTEANKSNYLDELE